MTKKSTTEVTISVKVKGKLSITLTIQEAHELKEALDSALGISQGAELKKKLEELTRKAAEPSTFTSYPPIVVHREPQPLQPGFPRCSPIKRDPNHQEW